MDRLSQYNWVIYKIESPSGRIYIGKTCDFIRRVYQYEYSSSDGQVLLSKSFKKYGFNNHTISIIESFIGDLKKSNDRESYWILFYQSNASKFPQKKGLNLTDGGEGTAGLKRSIESRKKISAIMTGKKHKQESKDKISLRNKGKKHGPSSVEKRLKISIANKGRKPDASAIENMKKSNARYWLGKERSDETKRKVSIKHSGKTLTEEHKIKLSLSKKGKPSNNRRIIYKFDMAGNFIREYPSILEASKGVSRNSTAISNNLSGLSNSCGGYIFKYKN